MSVPQNVGYKRKVVGAHYGTKDFLIQRVTACVMAIYTVVLAIGILMMPAFTYQNWVALFNFEVLSFPLGKLLAFLAFMSVLYHAWVGIRNIWMDYVKAPGVRFFLHVLTVLWLLACAAYTVQILWRI